MSSIHTNVRTSRRVGVRQRARAVRVLAGLGVATLAGCNAGPDYREPEIPTPPGYSAQSAQARGERAQLAGWWKRLGDPVLDELVLRSASGNLDLREAAGRIAEARAQLGVSDSGLLPSVDTNGSYTRQRFSESQSGAGLPGATTSSYRAALDMGWEIDVFGRIRRDVESASAALESAEYTARDVLVTLTAEVARNYVQYRSAQQRLGIAQDNTRIQTDSLGLVQSRFKAGLVSELDVARARTLLATTRATIPPLEQARVAAGNRLAVLLGVAPGSLSAQLDAVKPVPSAAGVVPAGLPSDLLKRRADVRSAERTLASRTAAIGVATADLLPRFSLTGSFGFSSAAGQDLFEGSSRIWSFGPAVKWNIFDAGRIRSNIAANEARTDQALARYQRSVLAALEDVENAMTSYAREQERQGELREGVVSGQRAVDLANELYSKGLTDFNAVLDAQRQLLTTQDSLAQSDSLVSTDLIALYKALGGGWDEADLIDAAPKTPGMISPVVPSWISQTGQTEVNPIKLGE